MVTLYLVLFFLLFFITLFCIWIHIAPLKKGEADVLVILGYKCNSNRIHPFLEERLLAAIDLLQSFHFEKVIVTGGKVSSTISEAEIMKAYLVKKQVDENRILLEKEAANTVENLKNCKKIMDSNHLKTCIIVSNSFHLRRVQFIARSIRFPSNYYCYRNPKTILKQGIRTINELRVFIKDILKISVIFR
jgi:uncharacterized SAM-binding protein YcdF (DUF218 family)